MGNWGPHQVNPVSLGCAGSVGGEHGWVVDDEGCGPCFAIVHVAHVKKMRGEIFRIVAVRVSGMEQVGGGEALDAGAGVVVHATVAADRHPERPPSWGELDTADFLAEVVTADNQVRFIFGKAAIVGAVELNEEPRPIVFLFFDVSGEEENFFLFRDGGLEIDAVAEVAARAIFPLVEGGSQIRVRQLGPRAAEIIPTREEQDMIRSSCSICMELSPGTPEFRVWILSAPRLPTTPPGGVSTRTMWSG